MFINNIWQVYKLERLRLQALSYCSETVTAAQKSGHKLTQEVSDCEWAVVCVDPEYLSSKEWHTITDNTIF